MPIRWGERECVDVLESVVGDWNCTLAANFENIPSNINSTQNQIIVSTSTSGTGYPISKSLKHFEATKRQHLTRHPTYQPIKKVIFSNPATIVFWNDGSKTIVKCSERDEYDPEKGLAMAIAKKFLGNKGNYYNTFIKYIPELGDKEDEQ